MSRTENPKQRAPRNRNLTLTDGDRTELKGPLVEEEDIASVPLLCRTVHGHFEKATPYVEKGSVDLLILDPPYNLSKVFGEKKFSKRKVSEYSEWLDEIVNRLVPLLSSTATVYFCGDWHTSASIFAVASKYFMVRNRVTWEREKGRGAKTNWKNSSEDIWFCTVGNEYTFNVDAVKLRRKVIAPYTHDDGSPKDWKETTQGRFRDTHPSNMWTDITIPFWSMPENTDHPTQKSEKLFARLILASSNPGDLVLDPFLGSGTTSVVAKKLRRNYIGIEVDEEYCLLAEKRLELAEQDKTIQGYYDGVFWERNTFAEQLQHANTQNNNKRKRTEKNSKKLQASPPAPPATSGRTGAAGRTPNTPGSG